MLERVRGAMQSGGTYVLVAFLIVIFAFFFGMPTNSCVRPGRPGQQINEHLVEVAGESLSTRDLSILLSRFPDDNRQPDDQEGVSRQDKEALHTLVAIKVLAHLAGQHGIYAGTEEFREFMRNPVRNFEYMRVYGSTGKWNGSLYKRYVQNQLGRRLTEYEQFKQQELKARKFLGNAVMQAGLLPGEADMKHAIQNTNINLEYVTFDESQAAKDLEVSTDTIETYLSEQSDRIQTYYDDNKKDEFTKPKQLKISRVFIRKPGPNAGDDKKKEINKKWEEAKKRVLENNESIAKVSDDLADGKSDLGFRPVGSVTEQVSKALQDADIGTVKDVETPFAYIIAKLEGRKDKKVTKFEDAKREIAEKLASEDRAKELIKSAKSALYKKAKDAASLSRALELLAEEQPDNPIWTALTAETTGDFTLESSGGSGLQAQLMMGGGGGGKWAEIPGIGTDEQLAAIAFEKLSKENPLPDKETFTIDKTDYLVRLKSKSTPEDKPDAKFMTTATRKRASEIVGGPQGMRVGMLPGFLKGWQSLFIITHSKFGTWVDRQIRNAVDNDVVTFNRQSALAASVLNDIKPEAVQTQKEKKQQKGKSGKGGGPSIKKLKTGSGGGKSINIKQGGGSKSLNINPKSGSSSESDSPSGAEQSGESGSPKSSPQTQ